ncbi:iron-containing redox enzyme family protein, partial [Clostridium perfringens]|nr:iron-containing redox enzyme family protein [Clostridium perfringens]
GLTLSELGLDPSYHAYLPVVPGWTLAGVNAVSLFGLHRRWLGAAVGHLAMFEMTSVEPMGASAAALRRLGFGSDARHFYAVHVVADAHHQHVA